MKKWIKETNIRTLTVVLLLLSLAILTIGGTFGRMFIRKSLPPICGVGFLIFVILIASLSGVIQIIKRESPGVGFHTYKGIYALINGWLWVLICLGAIVGILYYF